MPADYDATEFVDDDFKPAHKTGYPASASAAAGTRAPSREEVDSKVGEMQQKLAELKRVQEELERERAGLEETRRRQMEFQKGREEALQNLTRGIGLLAEAEFNARRDAEQMAKSLVELQAALAKVESTSDHGWTKDNFSVELTRALTVIENARMEWNTARMKHTVLDGAQTTHAGPVTAFSAASPPYSLSNLSLGELFKIGLALTLPSALVALVVGLILALLLRH